MVKTCRSVFLLSRAGGDGNYIPSTHGRVKRDLIPAARICSIGRRLRCSPSRVLQQVGVWPYYSNKSSCESRAAKMVTGCGPWDNTVNAKIQCISFCFVPHHSSCAVARKATLCLFHVQGSGYRWTRGDGTKPVFAIKPESPSFSPSSLISGTSAWGVLDYAVHTFRFFSLFFVSRILLVKYMSFASFLPSLGGFHFVSLIGRLPSSCRAAMMARRVSCPWPRGGRTLTCQPTCCSAAGWIRTMLKTVITRGPLPSPSRPHPRIPCA